MDNKKTLAQSEIDALMQKYARTDSAGSVGLGGDGQAAVPAGERVLGVGGQEKTPGGTVEQVRRPDDAMGGEGTSAPGYASQPPSPSHGLGPAPVAPAEGAEIMASLGEAVSELSERVSRMEAALGRLEKQGETRSNGQSSDREMRKLASQVKRVAGEVQAIRGGLQCTLGYDIGRTFTCGSCKSSSFVALYARCTACGREGWWGWWPSGQSEHG